MKKFFSGLMCLVLMIFFANVALAKTSPEEKRAKLDQMSVEVLERVYKKYPAAERVIAECYGYSTISSSSIKLGFWGGDHGRGIAVNNKTGEKIYMKMKEVTLGINIGAKEYDLVFVISDEEAWKKFISGGVKFGTEATAAASDGINGETYAGASIAAKGVWVYQMNKKGVAFELSLKGARITPSRTLNKKKGD